LRNRAEAGNEAERRQILHALEQQRLQRQVDEHEYLIDREIRAPESGTVARVIARAGSTVRAGETLVRIYRRSQGLEAWLYLASSKAAFLRAGQSVQLRLDAYPYQLFGTSNATITSISEIAMVPREVRVPLLLDGPVFEVRATLDQQHVDAFNAIWRLAPGTSFQADLIQRRYRLYEWLLRAVIKGSDGQRG
jgi:membrane fusion protein